ncbi:helix-turn-helix domain-containing protein [Paenibacillus agricola]|uniref:AraC family transcriptional regulator n=1 Tax=Paenibacillus agricola TaxID=2716264 RepID=A0ABX0J281_9BACL|nr:helix-turn-helix domain-containing protein [Paenibacillus agricola]NHN30410.1 AraC family transcriptional regulator [Paenibacillus agricola]
MDLKKLLLNRRSVVMTWLISYILVLFVPILFSAALYGEAKRTIDEQIQRANDTLLKQMQDAIDNEIDQINRLTNEIYSNVKVRNLFYTNKFSRGDYSYDLYEITQDLGAYRSTFSNLAEFYIYWAPGDLALTPMVHKPSELLFSDLYSGGELSLQGWKEKLSHIHQRQAIYTSRTNEAGNKQTYVNFISPFPADNNDKPVGSIVVMIDKNKLLHTISGVGEYSGSDVFILNESNQVLVSNTTKEIDLSLVSRFFDKSGNVYGEYQGEESQFFYIKSNNSKLTYLSVVPSYLIWKASAYVRNIAVFSIGFSLLGGCLLTLFFLRRNYKPLDALMQSMAAYTGTKAQRDGNEFHLIQNTFKDTMDEKEQISHRLKQQQNQLRAHWISRLLKGRMDAQLSLEEATPSFQLQFVSRDFCVMLFYLEDSDPFFEKIKHHQVLDKLKLMQFIVTNVVEELVNKHDTGYIAEVDDMLACLINVHNFDKEQTSLQLAQIVEEARSFLMVHYEIEVTIAISGFHVSKLELPDAYNEALDAMEHKLIMGKRKIIWYEELRQGGLYQSKEGYYYPLQTEQQLINFIKLGLVDQARSSLNHIIDRNLHQTSLSLEFAKCLLFNLVSTLIKTMNEVDDIHQTFIENHPHAIENLTNAKTVEDMHKQLIMMLESICLLAAVKQEENKLKLKDNERDEFTRKIVKYVEDNYADTNLNISMIGDSFGMKATYLSKLFKDQSGEGLLDFINKLRIEKAKDLLKAEEVPIMEIANRSGFNDLNTFMRIFKKLEGVTPGKYKIL